MTKIADRFELSVTVPWRASCFNPQENMTVRSGPFVGTFRQFSLDPEPFSELAILTIFDIQSHLSTSHPDATGYCRHELRIDTGAERAALRDLAFDVIAVHAAETNLDVQTGNIKAELKLVVRLPFKAWTSRPVPHLGSVVTLWELMSLLNNPESELKEENS